MSGDAVDAKDLTFMPLQEFIDRGYLMEVNRRFLHPLGLALMYQVEDNENGVGGNAQMLGIVDVREDPEGIYYAELTEFDRARIDAIRQIEDSRRSARAALLGYWIQP